MTFRGLRISGAGATNARGFSTLEIPVRDSVLLGEATMAVRAATTHLCLEIVSLQRRVGGDGAISAKGFSSLEIPVRDSVLLGEAMIVLKAPRMGLIGRFVC